MLPDLLMMCYLWLCHPARNDIRGMHGWINSTLTLNCCQGVEHTVCCGHGTGVMLQGVEHTVYRGHGAGVVLPAMQN